MTETRITKGAGVPTGATASAEGKLTLPASWAPCLIRRHASDLPMSEITLCRELLSSLHNHGWHFIDNPGEKFDAVPDVPAEDRENRAVRKCSTYTVRRDEHPLLPTQGATLTPALSRLLTAVDRLRSCLGELDDLPGDEAERGSVAEVDRDFRDAAAQVCAARITLRQRQHD